MRLLAAASIVLMTVACSSAGEFDQTVSNPDDNYMSDLARELDAARFDFRVLRDGSIAYRSRDAHTFRAIEERLKKDPAARAADKR